jgi:drug/metabolite transporter (DMT)-like permease
MQGLQALRNRQVMTHRPHQQNAAAAIASAIAASIVFSLNDMGIKFLSGGYPLHEIVLLRSVSALAITLAVLVPFGGGFANLLTRRPLLHALRGVLVVISNMLFFLALASVSLAETTAIFFVAPLLIAALSVVVLGEIVGPWRWSAIAAGFAGVLIVLDPGGEAFRPAALLSLGSALAYGATTMITRLMRFTESAATMTFYVQLFFLVSSAAFGLLFGDGRFAGTGDPSLEFLLRPWVALPPTDLAIVLGIGATSAVGGYFYSRAYANAEAGLVAPFEYAALLMAIFWGIVVFGEWPNGQAIAGMSLIVASGMLVIWRTRVKGAAAAVEARE